MTKYFELDVVQVECFALIAETLEKILRKNEIGELSVQQFIEVQQLCNTIRRCHLFKDGGDEPRYSEEDLENIQSGNYEDGVDFLRDLSNDCVFNDANFVFFDNVMDANSGAAAPSNEGMVASEVVRPAHDRCVPDTTDEKMEQ